MDWGCQGWGGRDDGGMRKMVKKYKLPIIRGNSGDGMYGMVTTVDNTGLYTWKLLRETS